MDLDEVLAILGRLLAAGLLLDLGAPVRQERDRAAVRGEARMPVVPGADRELPRLAICGIGRDEPQGVAVLVEAGRDGL